MGAVLLTKALRVNHITGERKVVSADEAHDKTCAYYCADCEKKGQLVRLKFMPALNRSLTLQTWDLTQDRVLSGPFDAAATRTKHLSMPAHFDRWPGAAPHACDQPVRYAAFRKAAFELNAAEVQNGSFAFTLLSPGQNIRVQVGKDIRNPNRPVGLDAGGIRTPSDFIKLFDFFKRDPGLQNFQSFYDYGSTRSIEETYFENVAGLHGFLADRKAVGKEKGTLVCFSFNPNTHPSALKDKNNAGGFADRSRPEPQKGVALSLFAFGESSEAEQALSAACLRHGKYKLAPVLLYGMAFIDPKQPLRVKLALETPEQILATEASPALYPAPKDMSAGDRGAQLDLGL